MTSMVAPQSGWRVVDIVVASVLGVAFGVVFQVWNGAWELAKPIFIGFPPIQGVMYGIWLVPAVLVPLIERFARRGGASITPRTARYCRNLTAAWAAWLALLAATGVGIALSHDERVGASWALVNYALVGGFFAAEFAWRRHRSPDAGGWWAHVRNARGGWRTPRG